MFRLLFIFAACPVVYSIANILAKDVIDPSAPSFEITLTEADFAAADQGIQRDLTNLGIKVKDDPTMGNKMEGDIAIENIQEFVKNSNQLGRNAIRQGYRRWPNGEIPYTMSSQYGSYARSIIAKAMKEYHDKTCVRFVPRDPARHHDYVYIHPDDGCYSLVGKTGGRQPLSLDSGCIQVGTIVHELMHAVGFFHEQSRQDRDQFIEIQWRNVMNGADDQFEKYNLNVIDHLSEPYDYSSIMHYGPYAFSGSGKKTIVPRQGGSERMGQRIAFSDGDLRKIKKLYQCDQRISGNSITEQETCVDENWRCPFWGLFVYCDQYDEIKYIVCPRTFRNAFASPGFILVEGGAGQVTMESVNIQDFYYREKKEEPMNVFTRYRRSIPFTKRELRRWARTGQVEIELSRDGQTADHTILIHVRVLNHVLSLDITKPLEIGKKTKHIMKFDIRERTDLWLHPLGSVTTTSLESGNELDPEKGLFLLPAVNSFLAIQKTKDGNYGYLKSKSQPGWKKPLKTDIEYVPWAQANPNRSPPREDIQQVQLEVSPDALRGHQGHRQDQGGQAADGHRPRQAQALTPPRVQYRVPDQMAARRQSLSPVAVRGPGFQDQPVDARLQRQLDRVNPHHIQMALEFVRTEGMADSLQAMLDVVHHVNPDTD